MFLLTLLTAIDPINGDFFENLVDEHSDRLFSVAYNTLSKYGKANREDAEDLVQETFIKVFRNIKRFYNLDREEIIGLLVIYTKYTVIDFLRKKQHKFKNVSLQFDEDGEDMEIQIADTAPLPDEIVIQNDLIGRCAACIDTLPESQRAVIMLKYRYGYKDKEIAAVLGISETSVSSRLNRARYTLRKMMGDDLNG